MTECTTNSLAAVIAQHGGVLKRGKHNAGSGACCVLEARSACLGLPWTDDPYTVGMPDIRPLNDGPWSSDAVMTEAMMRVSNALTD